MKVIPSQLSQMLVYFVLSSQCRIHQPSRYTVTTNLVRNRLELCFDYNHMRLDFSAPECAPTESMEGMLEQVETDILGDHCTYACFGLGG